MNKAREEVEAVVEALPDDIINAYANVQYALDRAQVQRDNRGERANSFEFEKKYEDNNNNHHHYHHRHHRHHRYTSVTTISTTPTTNPVENINNLP